jgi:hypothetical protein
MKEDESQNINQRAIGTRELVIGSGIRNYSRGGRAG